MVKDDNPFTTTNCSEIEQRFVLNLKKCLKFCLTHKKSLQNLHVACEFDEANVPYSLRLALPTF